MKISYIFLTFTIYVSRIRSCQCTLKIKLTVLEIALVRSWAAPCLIFVVWRGFVEPVSLLLQRLLRKHNVFFNKYQLYSQNMELFGKRKEGCIFGPVWNKFRIARLKETKKIKMHFHTWSISGLWCSLFSVYQSAPWSKIYSVTRAVNLFTVVINFGVL